MSIHEPKLTIEQERDEKIYVVTKSIVTLPSHNITIVPIIPINYPDKICANILLEMEENTFFSI